MVLVKVKIYFQRNKNKKVSVFYICCSSFKSFKFHSWEFSTKTNELQIWTKVSFSEKRHGAHLGPYTKILLFPYWKSLDRMLRRTSQTTDTIICISCSVNLLLNGTKKLFLWDRRILLKQWCCLFLAQEGTYNLMTNMSNCFDDTFCLSHAATFMICATMVARNNNF